jgi:regulator of protease activity HflC (stomatin/prohibitin superfamily)
MRTLERVGSQEDDPTTVFMFDYLLSLDEQYDRQAASLRECIHRAEEAEKKIRSLEVQLAKAKAQAAKAESCEAAALEASKQAEDRYRQKLKDFYLVTRAKRRILTLEEREDASHVIFETWLSVDGEEVLPLTQPPPCDDDCSHDMLPKASSSSEACS